MNKIEELIELIEKEIEWCKNNQDKGRFEDPEKNKISQNAFIGGLYQAKTIAKILLLKSKESI